MKANNCKDDGFMKHKVNSIVKDFLLDCSLPPEGGDRPTCPIAFPLVNTGVDILLLSFYLIDRYQQFVLLLVTSQLKYPMTNSVSLTPTQLGIQDN